jgi:hypothetical protein
MSQAHADLMILHALQLIRQEPFKAETPDGSCNPSVQYGRNMAEWGKIR